jgi:hypothetical protein
VQSHILVRMLSETDTFFHIKYKEAIPLHISFHRFNDVYFAIMKYTKNYLFPLKRDRQARFYIGLQVGNIEKA